MSKFFLKEWKKLSPEDIKVQRLQAGLCNTVYAVERRQTLSVSIDEEPSRVVIRFYGGGSTKQEPQVSDVSVEAQTLIIKEAAKLGLGPKLYGIFGGGRIEEFIPSRHLTTNDLLEKPDISAQVAIALAKFHSMDLPLPRPQYDIMDVIESRWGLFERMKEKYLTNEGVIKNQVNARRITQHDFASDIAWLRRTFTERYNRVVLQHWDTQFSNILIREDEKAAMTPVLIIDVEMATYNFRGKDMGLLLSQTMIDFQHPCDKIDDFPSEEKCKEFLSVYQKAVAKLGFIPDFDDNGMDSLEHLYMETLLGAIVSALCFLMYFLAHHEQYTNTNDVIIVNTERIFDWYLHVHKIFNERFPQIN
jgi:choline/ethanolamine kinase